jgi:hypothetical protein
MYDLKKMLQKSNANIPPELNRHEAALTRPGTFQSKKRYEETIYNT